MGGGLRCIPGARDLWSRGGNQRLRLPGASLCRLPVLPRGRFSGRSRGCHATAPHTPRRSGAEDRGVGAGHGGVVLVVQLQQNLVLSRGNFKSEIINRAGVINLLSFPSSAEGKLGQIRFADGVGEVQDGGPLTEESDVQKQLPDVLSQNDSKSNVEVWF